MFRQEILHGKKLRIAAFAVLESLAMALGGGSAIAQDDLTTTSDTVMRTVTKAPAPPLFRKLGHARSRCPFDVQVWLDPHAKNYLLPGQPGYAVGMNAAFACKREADAFGDRPARK